MTLLSKATLIHGDCLEKLRDLADKSIDLIVTDPPYEIETKGKGLYRQDGKNGDGYIRKYTEELQGMKDGFSEEVLDELCRVMKKINIYFFCSQKQIIPLLEYFVKKKKCNWNILSWHKTNPVPACGNKYLTDTEFILFFREKGVKVYGTYDTKHTFYVTPLNREDKKKYNHPTCKPVDILENLIENSSLEGEGVLDPFMGSGSTGVAAVRKNRKFVGIEIEEKYYRTAVERIQEVEEQN